MLEYVSRTYPLVIFNIAIELGPVETVGFPSKKHVIFHCHVNVYQRGNPIKTPLNHHKTTIFLWFSYGNLGIGIWKNIRDLSREPGAYWKREVFGELPSDHRKWEAFHLYIISIHVHTIIHIWIYYYPYIYIYVYIYMCIYIYIFVFI